MVGSRHPDRDTKRNTLANLEAFRELQDQLAKIQDQIHIGHYCVNTHRESPFIDGITFASIPNDFKLPRKDMCGFGGTEDPEDHLDFYLD